MAVDKNALKFRDLGKKNMYDIGEESKNLIAQEPYPLLASEDFVYPKAGQVHFEKDVINMVSGSTLVDPVPRGFVTYSSIKKGLRAFLKGLFCRVILIAGLA